MTIDVLLFGALALLLILLIMQNRRRRKEIETMQGSLAVGSEVILHAGIKGRVLSITGDDVEIESAGSKFIVLRGAVGKVLPSEAK